MENSLPESSITIDDIEFDIPFEHNVFRTKYEIFVGETMFDQFVLQTYTSEVQSVKPDFDKQTLQSLDKLQYLVSYLNKDMHEAYIQKSVELSALTVAASYVPLNLFILYQLVPLLQ